MKKKASVTKLDFSRAPFYRWPRPSCAPRRCDSRRWRARGEPQYIEGVLDEVVSADEGMPGGDSSNLETDLLYDQACEIVLKTRRASISLVQRHLRIGYNRAARLIEQMERAGMVSTMQSNGNREVLAPAPPGE